MNSYNSIQKGVSAVAASQIRGAMARRRLNMRGLSDLTKIPYRTLQGYLLGRYPTPADALARIAEALGVSADWLIFARPATLDRHCLAIAISLLDETRNAAKKTGHDLSLLSLSQMLSDFYEGEYLRLYGSGEGNAESAPPSGDGTKVP